jgi:hypothetical protein
MKIAITGFMRATLKSRIKRTKTSIIAKQKLLTALEKELAKLNKRK